jgi:hypothetical protein
MNLLFIFLVCMLNIVLIVLHMNAVPLDEHDMMLFPRTFRKLPQTATRRRNTHRFYYYLKWNYDFKEWGAA